MPNDIGRVFESDKYLIAESLRELGSVCSTSTRLNLIELADFVDSHNMVELPEEVSAQIKLNAVHWALTMIEHKLVCMNQTIKAFDIKAKVNLILDEFK